MSKHTLYALRLALCMVVAVALSILDASRECAANGTQIRNLCRIKGQEESEIRGLGLVIGLNGTGDASDIATLQAYMRSLQLMGSPLGETTIPDPRDLQRLGKTKNIALAIVTATIPKAGARKGDRIDCRVAALNGKSIEGGQLAFATLIGPNVQEPRVFGLAQGMIQVADPNSPLVGTIHRGCQVVQDVFNPFELNGYVTLVLDEHHAGFVTANAIASRIREARRFEDREMVQAIDAANIVVKIPDAYMEDPVLFISEIMEERVYREIAKTEARVSINEQTGRVVIGGDVEIGEVVVTHKNIVVEAAAQTDNFVGVTTDEAPSPRLSALVQTLNRIKVPPQDIIDIIKGIEKAGKLRGHLIIE